MRRNVGTEKDTAYGGARRPAADLSSILPPASPPAEERRAEEAPPGEPAATDADRPDLAAAAPGPEMLTVTVDGVEVKVPRGTTVFQASEAAGYTPPHFCYHRDLSIPANCRMCLCEIEGQGKLQTSCSIAAADGMVVRFDVPKVRSAVRGVMEFEFKNHPLDCPVCDQVGECYLQKYYLEVGRYTPLPIDRVHKDKVKDLGPITLDAERCVLCSRCVRFGEEIAGTADFVIANRSDHAEIMTFDDRPVATQYALNYTDVCPVGALTSNDFRFRKRVYWLKSTPSVCPECSTGCNVYVDTAENEVYRYRPRWNDDVNDSWMCDPGRLSYAREASTLDRIAEPLVRKGDALAPVGWDEAIALAAAELTRLEDRVLALAHPRMSNEDLGQLAALVGGLGGRVDVRIHPTWGASERLLDGILIREDPHPNTRGALEILGVADREDVGAALARVVSGEIRGLIVCGWDATDLGEAGAAALEAAEWVCYVGPRANRALDRAHLALPTRVHFERGGSFTNGLGRVQRFAAAIEGYEQSRPAWAVFAALRAALGQADVPATAAEAFAAVAATVPAFAGLTWDALGDHGVWLAGAAPADGVPPVGARPRPGVRAPSLA